MNDFNNGTTTVLQLASKLLNLFCHTGLVCEHVGYEELIKVHFIKFNAHNSGFHEEELPKAIQRVLPSNTGELNKMFVVEGGSFIFGKFDTDDGGVSKHIDQSGPWPSIYEHDESGHVSLISQENHTLLGS